MRRAASIFAVTLAPLTPAVRFARADGGLEVVRGERIAVGSIGIDPVDPPEKANQHGAPLV